MIFHDKLAPTPAMLVHCAIVSAVVTEQLVAVYPVPPVPYVAVTEPRGPKFVPLIVATVPPAVGIEPPPATDEITGGVYDTVASDAELGCDPTVTIHVKDAPTPAADVH